MAMISTPSIDPIDLINFSKDIAQLNLGYLGISVAILGVLGGVFVYFNLKPLKETLEKQEKAINELGREARDLLGQSSEQTEERLVLFRKTQDESVSLALDNQKRNADLEIKNQIQAIENLLSEKIETISESKDIKLKENTLSEVTNLLSQLEKNLTLSLNNIKNESEKKLSSLDSIITGLKAGLKEATREIEELKIYKYSKEKQMGAIIGLIKLLKEDIDENRWSITRTLEDLKKEITGIKLSSDYIVQIEEQLARIDSKQKYSVIIGQIREAYVHK